MRHRPPLSRSHESSILGDRLSPGKLGWYVLLVALLSAPLIAHAQTPVERTNALLVILDVSGSMKDSVKGGVKRELAQRVAC